MELIKYALFIREYIPSKIRLFDSIFLLKIRVGQVILNSGNLTLISIVDEIIKSIKA